MKHSLMGIILFTLCSINAYGQCDFDTFVSTYFNVFFETDSMIEIFPNDGVGQHKHKTNLGKKDDCYNTAIQYFPSECWISGYACVVKNNYVLMFWKMVETDTMITWNHKLLLCDEKGIIIDEYLLNEISVDYFDEDLDGTYSVFFLKKGKIIWRLFKDNPSGEYTEKHLFIKKNKIVPQIIEGVKYDNSYFFME